MNPNKTTYNNLIRQTLFVLVLIAMGATIIWQLKFFIGCFLGSITLYIVLRRPMLYFTEQKHWKKTKASLFILLITAIILLGFGAAAFNMLYSKFANANLSSLFDGLKVISDKIYDITGYHIISKDIIVQSKDILMRIISGLLNTTYSIGANLFMMFVVLYFMLANARSMEQSLISYIPFQGNNYSKIKSAVKNMIFANALGIPLIMLGQATVATIGYLILGVPDAIFWGFLTGLFGIVPLLGTTLIWLPVSMYLLAQGLTWQAIVLIIYGAFIVGNVDTVIRFVILKKAANVHPLIAIFGVIMGIPLFGFWGIIFGPLLISSFLLFLKIYYAEYSDKELEFNE